MLVIKPLLGKAWPPLQSNGGGQYTPKHILGVAQSNKCRVDRPPQNTWGGEKRVLGNPPNHMGVAQHLLYEKKPSGCPDIRVSSNSQRTYSPCKSNPKDYHSRSEESSYSRHICEYFGHPKDYH